MLRICVRHELLAAPCADESEEDEENESESQEDEDNDENRVMS